MNGNWGDQNWINQKRQEALNSGWSASDVDKFINQNVEAYTKSQKQGAATQVLQQQGYATPEQAISNPEAFSEAGVPVKTKEEIDAEATGKEVSQKDKDKSDSLRSILNFVNTLEGHYAKGDAGNTNLGPITRALGIGADLGASLGLNAELKTFNDQKKGFVATLKELTGDTGVLTEQDAKRLLGILPSASSTKGEATNKFNDLRKQIVSKFGGNEGKKTTFNPREKGAFEALLPQTHNLVNSAQQEAAAIKNPQQAKDFIGAYQQNTNPINLIMNALQGQPQAQRLAGATGEVVGDVATVLGGAGLLNAGKNAILGKGASGALLRPAKVGSEMRSVAVQEAAERGDKVAGKPIIEAIDKWAKQAVKSDPEKKSAILKMLKGAKEQFKDGVDVGDAEKIYHLIDSGFKNNGVTKSTLEAGRDIVTRKALREGIDKVAPGFDKGTELIAKGLQRGKTVKNLGGKVAGAASLLPLYWLWNKLAGGQQSNQ